MRSGLDFDWLSKPFHAAPGTRFSYRDADPQIVGYTIANRTGGSTAELMDEHLFKKLGIQDFYWESSTDGTSLAADGLHLRPLDDAKIGRLLLDRGRWNGEQILAEDSYPNASAPPGTSHNELLELLDPLLG